MSETKIPLETKPQLRAAAPWWRRRTCTAEGTPGADSQGPGAHRLNALQESSTNGIFITWEHPEAGRGRLAAVTTPSRELRERSAGR